MAEPPAPLPALLGIYLLFGIGLRPTNPPITTSAVSGMAAMARGGPAFTGATHTVWWIVAGLGVVIFALGLIGFKRRSGIWAI
jgi:LPXTG-motif cell wall-anchored protein